MYVCVIIYIYIYIYSGIEIFLQWNAIFLQKVMGLLNFGSRKNYELYKSLQVAEIELKISNERALRVRQLDTSVYIGI